MVDLFTGNQGFTGYNQSSTIWNIDPTTVPGVSLIRCMLRVNCVNVVMFAAMLFVMGRANCSNKIHATFRCDQSLGINTICIDKN